MSWGARQVLKRNRHACARRPSPWPRQVPTSSWLTSRGKKGSQSSLFLLTWLADWLRQVNPNLLSRGYRSQSGMLPRFSHHRSPVLNYTGPVNPMTWIAVHGRYIALRYDSRAGSPLLRPSELSLQSGMYKHKPWL